ncbi:MAG TPA: ABC transporter ATP-binding protein [Terriglobia bacterium]|nr:ABC transporter ATP-binding protein [Terriglobia bacterium]
MSSSLAVQATNLTFDYPARGKAAARRALNGVSFDVRRGEIFALLGPNGGGKTTLFKILCTALSPTNGTAVIFGFDIQKQADEVRRRIGVVFQNPSLDKKLTVLENLRYHGQLYGLRGGELASRVSEMMERLAVADRARDLVETLSGGLARRVELAKGLLHRPELLILDEPSVGLDPGARHDLWLYLQRLREKEDVTILVTTHLIDEGDRSDRVLVLNEGTIVALDTPVRLKEQIGGDVISIATKDPDRLVGRIREKFGITPTSFNGTLRIEKQAGHAFISQVVDAFPDLIEAVNLSKPTLEDVFIARTGHRFWEDK